MYIFKVQAADSTPSNVSVKNTFIDDWIPDDAEAADKRIIQSMPHNMFGKSLSAELATKMSLDASAPSPVSEEVLPSSPFAGAQPENEESSYEFAIGTEVIIEGLIKAPMFNGALGTVHSWDSEQSRYNVWLAFPTMNGQQWAKVKGDNLRLAGPEAPLTDADASCRIPA